MKCVRNCSKVVDPYAAQTNEAFVGSCQCDAGFYWRVTDNKCVRNCTKEMDVYATGTNATAIDKCLCLTGYSWNDVTGKCAKLLAAGFWDYEPMLGYV